MRTDWIGLRVARWRDVAGMTQQQLGDAVGVSREYVSMIENGKRPVTKRSLLIGLTQALGVSINDLTGQPYEPRSHDDLVLFSLASGLRTALDEDQDDVRPADVAVLRAQADQVRAARMACDYATLATVAPGTVAQARLLVEQGTGQAAVEAAAVYVSVASDAAMAIKSHGHIDLATRLADSALATAHKLGEPGEVAMAEFTSAQCALTGGSRRKSLRLAESAANAAGGERDDRTLTLYGMLHLHAAMSAAALGRADDVTPHFAEAEQTAARVSSDPWLMELTAANIGVWRVAVALENGEPDRAPVYARRVDRYQLRGVHRRATLHIDTGRGLYAAGRVDRAVRQFLQADDLAPQKVRSRPWVRELVGQMVRDSSRGGGSAELRDLAVRVGIDPLGPEV
jgi:transcriptional regulator with XRE-family HTH domain